MSTSHTSGDVRVHPFGRGRPQSSLGRRMAVGLGLVTVLTLLAVAFLFQQLDSLRAAIQESGEQNNRLLLVLDTAYQEASLLTVVQAKMAEHIPAIFVNEVGASMRALETRRDELSDQLWALPEGDAMHNSIERVTASLGNTIRIAGETIRHVEDGEWPAAELEVAQMLEHHNDVGWQLYQLVALSHDRHAKAQARASEATMRMVLISVPLLIVALVVAASVVFATIHSITLGVEQLGRSARRLAEGHFEEHISVSRQDELGQVANSFNFMAQELQRLYSELGQQVAERTADLERRSAQLETAAQVAREAAAIQDISRLQDITVRLISERFGFYHAGLFLIDEAGEYAVLQAASSEGGARLLARGHKLRVGEVGIVGYTAGTGQPRIALDVGTDAVFFDNPELPDTRSEMALPLKVRGRVIGVLDIQSTQEAAFSEENVAILQTMADQVALAIANAHLLEESQAALRELETLYGRQVREIWQEREARQGSAYHYTGVGVERVPLGATPEATDLALEGASIESLEAPPFSQEEPGSAAVQDGNGHRLIVPVRLREQSIGSIVLRRDPAQPAWSPEELAMVEELSTQIALALENAHLLEETQRRAEQEQMLGQMTARFTRSLDTETLLQTAVRELGRMLRADEVSVHVGTPPARSTEETEHA